MDNPEINLTPTATLLEIDSSNLSKDQGANNKNVKQKKKIPCRTWGIAQESKFGIVLIHGLGAHAGWFEALSRRLKAKQIFVLSYDLVGFGKQKNEPYLSYRQWLQDTESVCAYLRSIMPGRPLFVLGNSMGALIALASCQSIEPSGLALLSPGFAAHPKTFNLAYQLSNFCKAIANPSCNIQLPYGINLITKQEQVRSWLESDPDYLHVVPAKMMLDLCFLTQSLRWRKINVSCPLFMLTAELDKIVDNQVNELIFQQIINSNKKKTTLSGALHDLALDPAVDQVTDLLVDWMNSVINQNRLAII